MKPTMEDVAELAQVSRATVSRVLSERALVSPAKRELVLAAVAKLGYKPHKKTYTNLKIGVVISEDQQNNPFYEPIIAGIHQGIYGKGKVLIYSDFSSSLTDIDGIITIGSCDYPQNFLEKLQEAELPAVMIGGSQDLDGFSTILIEERKAMIQVVQALVRLGHEKIAFVSNSLLDITSQERIRAYKLALLCNQLSVDNQLIITDSEIEKLLLSSKPSAIITVNDQVALALYEVASKLGFNIPQDLSVVGFGDIELALQASPRLSSVAIPYESMGKWAISLLTAKVNDQELTPVKLSVSGELIIRDSISRK